MDRIRIERVTNHVGPDYLLVQVWIDSSQEWQTLGGACPDYDCAVDCESTLEEFVNQEIDYSEDIIPSREYKLPSMKNSEGI